LKKNNATYPYKPLRSCITTLQGLFAGVPKITPKIYREPRCRLCLQAVFMVGGTRLFLPSTQNLRFWHEVAPAASGGGMGRFAPRKGGKEVTLPI